MKSNLVPTRIVNVNGVSTTVHKRSATDTSKTAVIPAPNLNPTRTTGITPEERAAHVDELCVQFHRWQNPITELRGDAPIHPHHPAIASFRKTLESYSAELIDKLYTASQRTDRSKGTYLLASEGKTVAYLHTYLALHGDDYERIFDTGRGYSFNISDAVDSLATYPQLPYEHTDVYYQRAIALTGVVASIQYRIPTENHWEDHEHARFLTYAPNGDKEHEFLARIANDDLVGLVLEHPDRWEQIADLAVERETDNAELIRSIIESGTSAVAEGTL